MKTFIIALLPVLCTGLHELCAQTYTPVVVTGFNNDVVAESGANAAAVTSTVLDLSNNILYTAAFAAANGIVAGLPNNGAIVNVARTYQLAAYNANNGLFLSANGAVPNTAATGTLTLGTPASFSRISLLLFSTEGATTLGTTLAFTDGTTVAGGNVTIQDWFNGGNAVISGFGRIARATAPPYTVDGVTGNNPRFYRFDIPIACSNQSKLLQSVTITYLSGGGSAFPTRACVMALSGTGYTPVAVTPVVTSAVCGNSNGSIALTVSGGTAPLSYSWNTTPVQTQPTAVNLPGGNYTCTITDANGCTTTYQGTVLQQSPVTLTAAASDTAICEGQSTTLTAGAAGGTVTGYTWQPGNATGASIVVTPAVSTRYIVSAQDAFGCPVKDSVDITVNPAPIAAFSIDTSTGCPDLPVTFTNQSQQADTWLWRFGDGGVSSAASPTHTYTTAGIYTVTLIAGSQQQCFDTLVQTGIIDVQPSPVAAFATQPGVNIPLEYSEARFSFSNQSQNADTYAWDFGDGNTSAGRDPQHRYALPGSYRVSLTVTNNIGCTDSTSQAWLLVVPDKVLRIPNAFSPNGDGVNDRWEVEGLRAIPGCRVEVYNRWGQQVFASVGYERPWDGTWHGKQAPVGTYYYVIRAKPKDKPYTGWVALLR
jgi:gliding motility-associated-like protein